MKRSFGDKKNFFLSTLVLTFLTGYILYHIVENIAQSLFFQAPDRINLLVYGANTAFYSLSVNESRDYVVYFPTQLKVQVPGGYADYKVGSLGKLVYLEKNPDLFRKTFAMAGSAFVNYYFYPGNDEVYFNETDQKSEKLSSWHIFQMKSNAGFLDKVYLALFVLNKDKDKFRWLKYVQAQKVQDDKLFESEEFTKKSIGLFFQKTYRNEKKNVQISYNSDYTTAQGIANILEGNGIRVNDITLNLQSKKSCHIIQSNKIDKTSATAQALSDFFDCPVHKGETDVYDIIFVIGDKEKVWQIQKRDL